MKNKNNKTFTIIFIVSILIFLISLSFLLLHFFPNISTIGKKVVPAPAPLSLQSPTDDLPENPKNFDELQKENPDIYAWVTVPGTLVDYPVLQSGDDKPENFYINHGLDGEYLKSGCVYSQRLNAKDFSDPNTVLYGHNMRDDSMFGSLHSYRKAKFFKENQYIYIYTRNHVLTYKIYAAYRYDNRHILNSFDFDDEKVFAEYLEMTKNPKTTMKNIDTSVELNTVSRIITLSTCITNDNYRYLVQGVLIDDQLTK